MQEYSEYETNKFIKDADLKQFTLPTHQNTYTKKHINIILNINIICLTV